MSKVEQRKMTFGRLAEIVAAFGAAPQRWPDGERDAALAFASNSEEARALVDDARSLDTALDAAPDISPIVSDALVARIMASRPRAAAPVRAEPARAADGGRWRALVAALWPSGSPAFAAGALAASIALGVCVGIASSSAVSVFDKSATTAATSSAGEQLVSLALAENEYPEEWQK